VAGRDRARVGCGIHMLCQSSDRQKASPEIGGAKDRKEAKAWPR
jgi:hypothetical protein